MSFTVSQNSITLDNSTSIIITRILAALISALGLYLAIFTSTTIIASIVMWVIGIILIIVFGSQNYSFDKTTGKLIIETKTLFSNSLIECDLKQINKIETKQEWQNTNATGSNNKNKTSKQIIEITTITFKNGTTLAYQRIPATSVQAEQIANFIGVPFEFQRAPTDLEVLEKITEGAGNTIIKIFQKK